MKKILAVLLAVTMLLGTMAVVASAGELYLWQNFTYDDTFVLGDANDDGIVNAMDSYCLKVFMAGVSTSPVNTEAADFDASGATDVPDAYMLKMCLAGAKSTKDFEPNQVHKMTIAGTDIRELSIVLPAGSTENDNTYFAYLNFMKYVRNVTGVEIPLCWGTASTEKAETMDRLSGGLNMPGIY